jgi:hypothetical protein
MDKEDIIIFFYNNLDTIAKIENGHKLYIDKSNLIQLDEPYMFQGIWRYCNSFSRKDAIYVLTKLYNDIEIYMNAIYLKNMDKNNSNYKYFKINENDYQIFINIIEKIQKSKSGIKNLQLTYENDVITYDEIQKIIDKAISLENIFSNMIQYN